MLCGEFISEKRKARAIYYLSFVVRFGFFCYGLAGIERGRGPREKRLERVPSEGKKNDGWVTVLRVLRTSMPFRDLMGQF